MTKKANNVSHETLKDKVQAVIDAMPKTPRYPNSSNKSQIELEDAMAKRIVRQLSNAYINEMLTAENQLCLLEEEHHQDRILIDNKYQFNNAEMTKKASVKRRIGQLRKHIADNQESVKAFLDIVAEYDVELFKPKEKNYKTAKQMDYEAFVKEMTSDEALI